MIALEKWVHNLFYVITISQIVKIYVFIIIFITFTISIELLFFFFLIYVEMFNILFIITGFVFCVMFFRLGRRLHIHQTLKLNILSAIITLFFLYEICNLPHTTRPDSLEWIYLSKEFLYLFIITVSTSHAQILFTLHILNQIYLIIIIRYNNNQGI